MGFKSLANLKLQRVLDYSLFALPLPSIVNFNLCGFVG